ncbi:AraC family transcriptional regulator [Pedobacter sp. MC2016-15]|uniref:helix-turn-helix domain-containing protein n=1 Tax=Pedobacter sp. MC2016-15 TaxID=2994473 RepID=UPI0022475267|nr:AraC family transcriptional regulator [Pedobacter sp. MC2016-15]MCX2479383.1 AraC family transcriptional regulator [Pedobacter sp. MC2016-15]
MSADRQVSVLKEQFIPDTIFLFVAKGTIQTYDGNKRSLFKRGDAVIAQKNRLAKYELSVNRDTFEPIVFCFEEDFLREFKLKHNIQTKGIRIRDSFIILQKNKLINSFITSIKPYHKGIMELEKEFETVKYEELLLILLKVNPDLTDVLFDFRKPGKIDLEAFMNKHYAFNVSNERFATLTGRSLSAFKRDFKTIFNDTPSHWLVIKRLEEAHYLINHLGRKPKDFYLDLGFESLSHFSVAYKNKFGYPPSRQSDLR